MINNSILGNDTTINFMSRFDIHQSLMILIDIMTKVNNLQNINENKTLLNFE